MKQRFGVGAIGKPYQRKHVSLRLHYGSGEGGDDFGLRFNLPHRKNPAVEEIVEGLVQQSSTDAHDVMRRIEVLESKGCSPIIYPDAHWADIRRVLVVCPASLKSQWRSEVQRFNEWTCCDFAVPWRRQGCPVTVSTR